MTFTLIVATLGRVDELDRLLDSLEKQVEASFEVVIVDQNPDDRVGEIIRRRPSLTIKHLRSAKGLSRARNVGLKVATGDIIGFPDDDCWYPPSLLSQLGAAFSRDGVDAVSIMVRDEFGTPLMAPWNEDSNLLVKSNVWGYAVSNSIFFTSEARARTGDFDEDLGVGAGTPWGAAEDVDYALRAVEVGVRMYYEQALFAYHPAVTWRESAEGIPRIRSYHVAEGLVMRRHGYSLAYVLRRWIRAGGAMLIYAIKFDRFRTKFYWAVLTGRIIGWRAGAQPKGS